MPPRNALADRQRPNSPQNNSRRIDDRARDSPVRQGDIRSGVVQSQKLTPKDGRSQNGFEQMALIDGEFHPVYWTLLLKQTVVVASLQELDGVSDDGLIHFMRFDAAADALEESHGQLAAEVQAKFFQASEHHHLAF